MELYSNGHVFNILIRFDDCPIATTEVRTISVRGILFLPKHTASRVEPKP